jgi:hypothetical protein
MRPQWNCLAWALLTLVCIAGCGRAQPSGIAPLPQIVRVTNSGSLIDVLDKFEGRKLSVYTFPGGIAQKRVLLPEDEFGRLCSDSSGNVYVPSNGVIFKYAHGGQRPIADLPNKGAFLGAICAGDPKTGNLFASGPGGLHGCRAQLYVHAKGNPTCIKVIDFNYAYPTYDGQGDLFFYGYGAKQNFLGELPAGGTKVVKIMLPQTVTTIWDLQWDGQDIAIQGKLPGTIDQPVVIERIRISGTKGTVVKTIRFKGWTDSDQHFLISGDLIVAPTKLKASLGVWNYPEGGKEVGAIAASDATDWTVSVAP